MVHSKSLTGAGFDDTLSELHSHTFTGVPGESERQTLSELELEYIALVLAYYYKCEHCKAHHGQRIEKLITKEMAARARSSDSCSVSGQTSEWPWKKKLLTALLYLRVPCAELSEEEWALWQFNWTQLATMVKANHGFCLSAVAYAIGIARDDAVLMDFIFPVLSRAYPDDDRLAGAVTDIDRVAVFMKAATSKNRVSDRIKKHLMSRGIV